MKKMLADFANGVLMLVGLLTFLVAGWEIEGAVGFWVRIAGMLAFLVGLDWRIKAAIRADRERIADLLERWDRL